MSSDLIAQFKADGTLEHRGQFQIDREKAREKMRKFQLPDPHAYVLEFVKAATLLGATRIFFGIDADEMRMTCDCDPLTAEELDNLYGAAFSKLDSERARALRHFAIGFTAAEALDLSTIEITTVGPKTGARYTLDSGGSAPQETIGSLEKGPLKTEIYFRKRFRVSHVLDFIRKFSDQFAEIKHLTEKVTYAEVPIYLRRSTQPMAEAERVDASTRLSFGRQVSAEISCTFETKTERCVMGLTPETPTRIRITQHGVLIADHFHSARPPFEAVVESSRLTTDLTQSAFVEDSSYHDLLKSLTTHRLTDLAVGTFGLMKAENAHHPWSGLEKDVNLRATLDRFTRTVVSWRRGGHTLPENYQRFGERLETFETWPLATSSPLAPRDVDLTSVAKIRQAGAIYTSKKQNRDLGVPGYPVVLLSWNGVGGSINGMPVLDLGRYLDLEVIDVTDKVEDREAWRVNRERWLDQPLWKPDDSSVLASIEFERENLKCTLSIHGDANPSKIEWIKEGRVLQESTLSDHHFKGLRITVVGDIEPDARFVGPGPSDLNKTIVITYISDIPNLIESYAEDPDLFWGRGPFNRRNNDQASELLISYLDHLFCGDLLSGLLAASPCNWSYAKTRDVIAQRSSHFALTPSSSVKVAPEPLESGGRRVTYRMVNTLEVSPADLSVVADSLGSLGQAPIFQELDGTRVSLKDLAEIFEEQGVIYLFHEQDHPYESARDQYEHSIVTVTTPIDLENLYLRNKANTGRIIWSNDVIDDVLNTLIGPNAQSGSNRLFFEESRRVFLEKPARKLELPERDFAITASFETELARFKIGMRYPESDDFDAANVDVRYEARTVEESLLPLRTGIHDVVVEITDEVTPDPSFEYLGQDAAHDRLYNDIRKACTGLMIEWLQRYTKTFDGPDSLNVEEAYFWSLVERLVPTENLDSIVVAQNEDGGDVRLGDLHGYARQNTIAYYRDGFSPVRELLPSKKTRVLKVRRQTPIESFGDVNWVDVSQTQQKLKALEEYRRRFLAKPVRKLEAAGIPESRVPIQTETMRGEIRVNPHEKGAQESHLEIWFHHISRPVSRTVVEEHLLNSIVPFGRYEAVIEGDSFELNADFTDITEGKKDAIAIAQRAAQDSFIALCTAWNASLKSRRHQTREILEHALARSLLVSVWPRACEKIRTTKLFEMADGSFRSYDELIKISEANGNIYWLFSFWRSFTNPEVLYSVPPSSVVLARSPTLLAENPSHLTREQASRFHVPGRPKIVEILSELPWKRAQDTAKESGSAWTTRHPLSAETSPASKSVGAHTHPIVEGLQDHFANMSILPDDRPGQLELLQRITVLSLGIDAVLARTRAGILELNVDHPAFKHYESAKDVGSLAFVAMGVLTAIRSPRVRDPAQQRALIARYTTGARGIL